MAAFPTRDRASFDAHWRKIRADDSLTKLTITSDGAVAGNIGAWTQDGMRLVGYWIGRDFWGKGIATEALRLFAERETTRPLHAFVAAHNTGSIKVLERCGFVLVEHEADSGFDDGVEELLYELV